MQTAQKITVHIPPGLLKEARLATGQGITATIQQGLKLLAASRAYEDLKKMRGKVKFSINLKKMKEDRT